MAIKSNLIKALALFLTVFVFWGSLPASTVSVLAQDESYIADSLSDYTSVSGTISSAPDAQREAIAEYLNAEFKNYSASVDVSQFAVPYDSQGISLFQTIISGDLPECFHIATSFKILSDGILITYIVPEYAVTEQEYDEMYTECMEAVDELLSGIMDNDKLGEVEKALLLHDRIALLCEYDYENALNKSVPRISHTMYGALVKGTAVCQGYALAYGYLLDQVGIDNYYCLSKALNHSWNIVYIGGKPYHVDLTWDDANWDITGRVYHDNFLRSTQGIISAGHEAADFDNTPTDTTYDNYFWQHSDTAFTLVDDEIYYIDNDEDHIVRYSDGEFVYDITTKWWADPTHIWADQARLDTDGKNLLFSLSDGIYKLDLKNLTAQAIYKPKLSPFWGVFGFTLKDNNLICDIYFTPIFDENTKKAYEVKVPYLSVDDEPTYTPGNINDDEEVNLQDIVALAQCIAGWDVSCNTDALDVNGDNLVNLSDVVHLAQYIAGWEEIKLH